MSTNFWITAAVATTIQRERYYIGLQEFWKLVLLNNPPRDTERLRAQWMTNEELVPCTTDNVCMEHFPELCTSMWWHPIYSESLLVVSQDDIVRLHAHPKLSGESQCAQTIICNAKQPKQHWWIPTLRYAPNSLFDILGWANHTNTHYLFQSSSLPITICPWVKAPTAGHVSWTFYAILWVPSIHYMCRYTDIFG